MRGLIFTIYHNDVDCTNHGISANSDTGLLIGDGIPEIFEARGRPVFKMEQNKNGYKYLVPADGRLGYRSGGNLGFTPDSRWPHDYPLQIHDRLE